jgi:hypothetical protein
MAAYKLINAAFIDGQYYYAGDVVDLDPKVAPKGAIALEEQEVDLLDDEPQTPVAKKK